MPRVRRWLLIEASREGVLRFATVTPSPGPRLAEIHELDVAGLPTFTEAPQRFERDKSCSAERGSNAQRRLPAHRTARRFRRFDSSFSTRRSFSRLILGVPVWRVDRHEAVLTGAAERLAHALSPRLSAAA